LRYLFFNCLLFYHTGSSNYPIIYGIISGVIVYAIVNAIDKNKIEAKIDVRDETNVG